MRLAGRRTPGDHLARAVPRTQESGRGRCSQVRSGPDNEIQGIENLEPGNAGDGIMSTWDLFDIIQLNHEEDSLRSCGIDQE